MGERAGSETQGQERSNLALAGTAWNRAELKLPWERPLTSFGVLCCGALTGVLGLAADTGLVKTESRPCMWRPGLLISLPPDFHCVL